MVSMHSYNFLYEFWETICKSMLFKENMRPVFSFQIGIFIWCKLRCDVEKNIKDDLKVWSGEKESL